MSMVPPTTQLRLIQWDSPEGRVIIREIIEGRLPHWSNGPRADQVECWSYTLAGRHIILIASTGWGKTAAFYGPILVLQHLLAHPNPKLPKPPDKPVAIIVTPLIELGNAHAREIGALGLRSVSLNAANLEEASKNGRNLIREIRRCEWTIVLLSAERLISPEVDAVLRDEVFRENLVLLGLDEAHLVVDWGKDFRKAYHQMALLRFRLPEHTTVVAASATMSNDELRTLLTELKLNKPGAYELIRRSSERPNLEFNFKNLTHSISGYLFPDIAWVFQRGTKAVIYCATLDLCFRVALYGWSLYGAGSRPLSNVRMWTSITSPSYNTRTLELFEHNKDTSVIIATVAFGMGMNLRNITDVVNLGLPTTLSALVQQGGRAGRDPNTTARAWTYVETSISTAITNELLQEMGPLDPKAKAKQKLAKAKRAENLDVPYQTVLRSHIRGHCVIGPMNVALSNPGPLSSLTCIEAKRMLLCSGCQPTPPPPPPPPSANPAPTPVLRTRKDNGPQLPPPLTKLQRENAQLWLDNFATSRWVLKDDEIALWMPACTLWDGISLSFLLSNMHLLRHLVTVRDVLSGWNYLDSDGAALFELLQRLNMTFDTQNRASKDEKARKSAENQGKKRAEARLATSDSSRANENKENNPPTAASSIASVNQTRKLTIRLPPPSRKLGPLTLMNVPDVVDDDGWVPPLVPVFPPTIDPKEKRPLAIENANETETPKFKRSRISPPTLTIA